MPLRRPHQQDNDNTQTASLKTRREIEASQTRLQSSMDESPEREARRRYEEEDPERWDGLS